MRHRHVSWVGALAALAAPGCLNQGEGTSRAAAVSLQDSAGVEIVVTDGPAWGEADGWTIDAVPAVEIGVLDGEEVYQLFEVTGARRLSDGTTVVAVGGTELRFYDAEGGYLHTVGREGEGPGEFMDIGSIVSTVGDTIVVLDGDLRRATFVTPSGEIVRELPIPADYRVTELLGMASGRLFGVGERNAPRPEQTTGASADEAPTPPPPSITRRTTQVLALDMATNAVDTIVERPGEERFSGIHTTTSMGEITGVTVMSRAAPLARSTAWSAAGDRLLLATNDRMSFDILGLDGTLIRRVRAPFLDALVDGARADSAQEAAIAALDPENVGGTALVTTMWELRELPEVLPRYTGAVLGSDGTVWLGPYGDDPVAGTGGDGPTRDWFVFGPDGSMLGTVAVPSRTELVQAGADWVLGLHQDEYDVEYVRVYRLVKPAG